LQLKKNNQGQQGARILACHDLGLSSFFITDEKTLRDEDELGGSLLSSTIEEKQPRITMSRDLGLLSFSTIEEKKRRDGDKLLGLLSSSVTHEIPTSRFFFLGCKR
jgi:hypothetical protein